MSVDDYSSGPAFSALMVPGAAAPVAFTGPVAAPYKSGPAHTVSFGTHTAMGFGVHQTITRFGEHVPVFGARRLDLLA